MLNILTSEQVLCMPFAGPNNLFQRLNKFFPKQPSWPSTLVRQFLTSRLWSGGPEFESLQGLRTKNKSKKMISISKWHTSTQALAKIHNIHE